MSLPEPWVDRIFAKLSLVYGHQFLSRWDGLPIDAVKADWAQELSRFQQNPNAVAYALEHLPAGKAPTVLEFRAICNSPQAPGPDRAIALPRYTRSSSDEMRDRMRAYRRQILAENPDADGWLWALTLELKDQKEPHNVTPTVRAMYREALATYPGRRTPRARTFADPQHQPEQGEELPA